VVGTIAAPATTGRLGNTVAVSTTGSAEPDSVTLSVTVSKASCP
jgi:hypothetical protein